jgi:hypothetical protein
MTQPSKNARELAIFSWARSIRADRWPAGEVEHEGENPDISNLFIDTLHATKPPVIFLG